MEGHLKSFFLQVLKATIISLAILLIGILVFSVVVKFAVLNNGVIKAVNQFIKTLAIFLGVFFSVKEGKGLLKGMIVGVAFTLLSYIVFSVMAGEQLFTLSFLIDVVFGTIIGIISGIIVVNIKKQ